jgi:hypothetical protein
MMEKESVMRIRRQRTKGWKMPQNTVYVGRPSRWANPFKIFRTCVGGPYGVDNFKTYEIAKSHIEAVEISISLFIEYCKNNHDDIKKELMGKNIACWCDLDQPCHADWLLEIANS